MSQLEPQTPPEHEATEPAGTGQDIPQPPQFSGSLPVSMQLPPQAAWPTGQSVEQVPAEQTSSEAHATPHPPQFAGSAFVSTHAPSQTI